MKKPPSVLLLSHDPKRLKRWEQVLVRANCTRISLSDFASHATQKSHHPTVDVVVTDQRLGEVSFEEVELLMASGDVGTIGVGTGSYFDVDLPSDHTDRELKIACLLLADNVRLRRGNRRNQRMAKLFRQLASSDPLTGLPNRRAWDDLLASKIQLAVEHHKHLCLGLIDLDHFKGVNSKYGLFGGDKVLKTFGQSLAKLVRRPDFVARLGGDEFGIVFSGASSQLNFERFNLLRTKATHSVMKRRNCNVTASVGFVEFDGSKSQGEVSTVTVDLFKAADLALQSAKSRGRDTTVASSSTE